MRIQIERGYTKDKKLNKVKIIIFVALVLALILFCASDYMVYFIKQLDKQTEDGVAKEKAVAGVAEVVTPTSVPEPTLTPVPQNIDSSNYFPVMTEVGMDNIKHIYSSDTKRAFLTFDDGPSYNVTNKILDILAEEDIKATFFVLGSMAEKYPDTLRRVYEEGHYIANHGYSHVYSTIYESAETVLEEYDRTNAIIAEILDVPDYDTHLFRFPGGSFGGYDAVKTEAKAMFAERNVAYLDWNALTRDSEGSFSSDTLLQNLKETVDGKNSVVILCHDASAKTTTYEALPSIISFLRDEGYEFANMKDLIE